MAVRYPERMDRRGWTLALCVFAVAAALFWRAHSDDGVARPEDVVAVPATDVEAPATASSVPDSEAVDTSAKPDLLAALAETTQAPPPLPPPTFTEPLPPWDAKLVDVLPALKARADAGDHVAACHIGLALSACALHLSVRPSKAQIRNTPPDDKDAFDFLAMRSTDSSRPGREATCDGLSADDLVFRFAYLQSAADAGNVAALRLYLSSNMFATMDHIVRHPEWLDAYRARAPRYLSELIRRGDAYTAYMMSMASDGLRISLPAQALDMDEMTAATFWHLGRLVRGNPTPDHPFVTPDIQNAARARAQSIHARYFDPTPYSGERLRQDFDLTRVENCAVTP